MALLTWQSCKQPASEQSPVPHPDRGAHTHKENRAKKSVPAQEMADVLFLMCQRPTAWVLPQIKEAESTCSD